MDTEGKGIDPSGMTKRQHLPSFVFNYNYISSFLKKLYLPFLLLFFKKVKILFLYLLVSIQLNCITQLRDILKHDYSQFFFLD